MHQKPLKMFCILQSLLYIMTNACDWAWLNDWAKDKQVHWGASHQKKRRVTAVCLISSAFMVALNSDKRKITKKGALKKIVYLLSVL